jgi:hypothetical protein
MMLTRKDTTRGAASFAIAIGLAALVGWLFASKAHQRPEPAPVAATGDDGANVLKVSRLQDLAGQSLFSMVATNLNISRCANENERPATGTSLSDAFAFYADKARQAEAEIASKTSTAVDPTERAVGLSVQAINARNKAIAAYDAQYSRRSGGDYSKGSGEAVARAAAASTDALAKLASTSDDPVVYALAFHACNPSFISPLKGQCAQLSPAQWARLEPSNAFPWIYVANEAGAQGDIATRDDALYHASQAERGDSHGSVFLAAFQLDGYRSQPAEVQSQIAMNIFSDAFFFPEYGQTMAFCGGNAVSDVNRRQVCDALADVLAERSETNYNREQGINIGERAGWPPERLKALRDRNGAHLEFAAEILSFNPFEQYHLGDCESAQKFGSFLQQLLQYGVRGAYVRQIAAIGQSEAELADRWRSRMDAQRAAADAVRAKQ